MALQKENTIFAPMNHLSQHIEYLLLTHNCVIVPQFGAFVAHTNNAKHSETEELFFPPYRVVHFNPDIVDDDGLLVGVISALHQCTATDAKRMIQGMILQLRQQLLTDGQVDFGGIGIFSQDTDGRINFSSCQAGVVTPSLYGLDAFSMSKLTMIQRRNNLADKHKKESAGFTDSDKSIVIHISHKTMRYIAAAAAVILILVIFAPPVQLLHRPNAQQASLIPSLEQRNTPVSIKSEDNNIGQTQAGLNNVENTQSATETINMSTVAEEDSYVIVLACDVNKKNAEQYVKDLQKRGFNNARVHDNGKILRVVLAGYTNENEAYNRNAQLHKESEEFTYSWVMKL